MRRISSPGAYSLCSVNSMEVPACRLWCMPANAPSTITRARTDRLARLASSEGSSARARVGSLATVWRWARSGGLDGLDHVLDDRPGGHPVGLGVEVLHYPVDQH